MTCFETKALATIAAEAACADVYEAVWFGPMACKALNLMGSGWYVWNPIYRKVMG